MKTPGVADAWSQQNTMAQQLKMFNQSRLSLIGSEVVEGVDCYKVRAEIDMNSMADQLSGRGDIYCAYAEHELHRTLPQYETGRLLLDHQRYSSSQEDGCTGDLHSDATVFGPECPNESENQEMRINAEISMLFEGFNESVNIKLPAEAKKAQPFPMGLMVSTKAVPVVPVGNETKT